MGISKTSEGILVVYRTFSLERPVLGVHGIYSASPCSMEIHCQPPNVDGWEESLTDRQERLAWFDQNKLSPSRMTLFGLGVGSRVAEMLVRKGIGGLDLVDHRRALEPTSHFLFPG